MQHYNHWVNNLTNVQSNIYSSTGKLQAEELKNKVFNACLVMMNSIVPEENATKLLQNKISHNISSYTDILTTVKKQIKTIAKESDLPKSAIEIGVGNRNFIQCVNKDLESHRRYEKMTTTDYKECMICGDADTDKSIYLTKLICGHIFCVQCIIDSIAKKNECPGCREYININRIIFYSKPNEISHLNTWLDRLDQTTVIVTDLAQMCKNNKAQVIYVAPKIKLLSKKQLNKSRVILSDLLTNHRVRNLVYVTSPGQSIIAPIVKIINYVKLLNYRINISKSILITS